MYQDEKILLDWGNIDCWIRDNTYNFIGNGEHQDRMETFQNDLDMLDWLPTESYNRIDNAIHIEFEELKNEDGITIDNLDQKLKAKDQ